VFTWAYRSLVRIAALGGCNGRPLEHTAATSWLSGLLRLVLPSQVTTGAMAMQMRKKDIHPEWYPEAKVGVGPPAWRCICMA
jgi:hypothetical protein